MKRLSKKSILKDIYTSTLNILLNYKNNAEMLKGQEREIQ